MNIINHHLRKQLLLWSVVALLALSGSLALLEFAHELSKVDEYAQLLTAVYKTWLSLPMIIYEVLPIAVLIGGLIGIGNVAAQNELLAAQAIGCSRKDIVLSFINPAMLVLFASVMLLMSEIAIPFAENKAIEFEEQEEAQRVKGNLWVRDKNNFIHIGKEVGDSLYRSVTVYEYNREHGRLNQITRADTMRVEDEQFLLGNLSVAQLTENKMTLLPLPKKIIPKTASLDQGLTRQPSPEHINFIELYAEIKALEESQLNADLHRLVLWKKLSAILSIIAMLMLAMPLLFVNNRENTLGTRLFKGMLLGLIYIIADRFAGNFFVVWQWPAWLGAFLIPMLVTVGAYSRLRR